MPEKKSDYRGHSIYYRIIGSGKPVVLLHGFGGDGEVWKNQIEFLKNKFQLIIPDLPGSGKSEMIEDMSIEGMAELIKAILDKENIALCTIIGHSMGGYITLAFAEKYPEHLNAFGLCHSTSYADSREKKSARRKGIEFINQHGAFEFLKTTSPDLFSPISLNEMKKEINTFINSLGSLSAAALVSYYTAMIQRPERTEILRNSKVPVLFIMGKYDNAVPLKDALEQCHLPEKSYIDILTKSGHMGMMEEAGKTNRALEEFLLSV
ncbi:MAG TPA: alpha/beta hydrolase [Chitinophagaceae bacterium]|nr:alpha/beta hydrolase [Chitinophagaceae bacterium]